jgi:hypothetical protein
MAHFAQLDDNNFVLQVIVVHNNELLDENGNESETVGITFCKSILGEATRWKQTSYNGKTRKNYAGIGYKYDSQRDAFIPPQPFSSWTLNEETCLWNAPTPMPTEGGPFIWNEETISWKPRISQTI